MEQKTKEYLRKVRFNTYIYTFAFMAVAIWYTIEHSIKSEPIMLLLAAFAFYTIGKQVRMISDLEAGAELDTKPRTPAWIRGVVYFVVLLLVLAMMFG